MSQAPIFVRVERGGLMPLDSYAAQQLSKLQPGAEYSARLSRITRTGREEREGMRGRWWAGLALLAESTEDMAYDTPRKAHEAILMGLKYVRPRFRIDGSFDMVPVSTSDAAMDDGEFSILQERARAFCEAKFGFDPFAAWEAEQDAKKAKAAR